MRQIDCILLEKRIGNVKGDRHWNQHRPDAQHTEMQTEEEQRFLFS